MRSAERRNETKSQRQTRTFLSEFEGLHALQYTRRLCFDRASADAAWMCADNSKDFCTWLEKEAQDGDLDGVKYGVFGLGSTQYEKYNTIGKLVDLRCEDLGARRIIDLTFGNDDRDIQQDFSSFTSDAIGALKKHFGITRTAPIIKLPTFRMEMQEFKDEKAAFKGGKFKSVSMLEREVHRMIDMSVTATRELVKGGGGVEGRSVMHVELSIERTNTLYETGDHVAIFPHNDENRVLRLAERVKADIDMWFSILDRDGGAPFPCPCSVRQALTKYMDICGAPKAHVLSALAECATAPEDRIKLEAMASKDGHEQYEKFVLQGRRGILELLEDFPSIDLNLAQLIEISPRLMPRYYSISSASAAHPEHVHITCAVVKEDVERKGTGMFQGVCSNYIARLKEGDIVRGFCRTTLFKLPQDPSIPVILIGAGAGIAPLRGMFLEIDSDRTSGEEIGQNLLVFGCRRKDEDFLYEDEVLQCARDGTLSCVFTAFSRDGAEKDYVQHKIEKHSEAILAVLNKGGYIYVCGSAAMATDVRGAITDAIVKHVKTDFLKADQFVCRLRETGKYLQDVW